MTKPARKPDFKPDLGTKERQAKGDVRITDALAKSERKARAETSVERIANQKDVNGQPRLSAEQVEAARRYYVCAAAYGFFGRYASMDMAREVFGASHGGDGAEWLEDRKREYIKATDLVSIRYRSAMHAIILRDETLTAAGKMMGGKGERAGQVALPVLIDTLDRLAAFFGLSAQSEHAA